MIAALLDAARQHADTQLAAWLAPKVASAAAVSADVGAAASAVERLALRGGKRLRAALVVAGFSACAPRGEGDLERALRSVGPAMTAIELLQVYLLVHDDWMDDDDVRRGGPAVHVTLRERLGSKALGDAGAVLAGDLACAYAQESLLESPVAPERLLAAARTFAKIQEDVVTGQLAEMAATANPDGAPSVETIHALKTASYTVTGPLVLGARLAGAGDAVVAQLTRLGRPLGVAFQLRDDLLGVFGDVRATGKPVGNDIRQGKRTSLVAAMIDPRDARRDAAAEALLARTLGRHDASSDDVEAVVRMMETSGAKARVEARLAELLAEARRALAAMELPESSQSSPARGWLEGAVTVLGERSA